MNAILKLELDLFQNTVLQNFKLKTIATPFKKIYKEHKPVRQVFAFFWEGGMSDKVS